MFDRLTGAAVNNIPGHQVACRHRSGIAPIGKGTQGDVAIRDHADQAVVFADGQGPNILVPHDACDRLDICFGRDPASAGMHGFRYFHRTLLCLKAAENKLTSWPFIDPLATDDFYCSSRRK
ncbi:hypothetical protein D9M72_573740 [compost metagenome]